MKRSFRTGIGAALLLLLSAFVSMQSQAGEGGTNSIATSDYTVTIPAEVNIDPSTGKGALQYSIAMERTNSLTVNVTSVSKKSSTVGVLSNGDDQISYSISGDTSVSESYGNPYDSKPQYTKTINLQVASNATPKYAGEYSDQLEFSISSTPNILFDLNAYLDGVKKGDLNGLGWVSIYKNDNDMGRVQDAWWYGIAVGDKIKVCDFYTEPGYVCEDSDPYELTVGADNRLVEINLHYSKAPTFTLNPCGGRITVESPGVDKGEVAVYTYKAGADYTLPIPTREGYQFDGWYTGTEDSARKVEQTGAMGSDSQTLYAHWKRKCTVTFDANGGSCETSSKSVLQGEKIGELPTPARDHCKFDGWYTKSDGGDPVTADTIVSGEDMTVYAHWTQFYLDINGYIQDERAHKPYWYNYVTAEVTVDGNRNDSFDDGYLSENTLFSITNIKAKEGYEYVGYFIVNYAVPEGTELSIPDGGPTEGDSISGTVSQYTSVYLVVKKAENTENTNISEAAIKAASEKDKTKTKTETDTKTDTANKTSTDTTADQSKDTSSTDAATDKSTETDKTTDTDQSGTDTSTEGKTDASDIGDSASGDASGKTDSKDTTGGTDSTSGGSSGSSTDSTADGSSGSTDGTTSGSSTDSSEGGSSDSNTDSAANGSSDSTTEAATDGNSDDSADSTSADSTTGGSTDSTTA